MFYRFKSGLCLDENKLTIGDFISSQGFSKTARKHKMTWHGFHLVLVLEYAWE